MKTNFLVIAVIAMLLTGCKKTAEDVAATPTPAGATCNNLSSFSLVQQDDAINYTLNTSGSSLYYESYWTLSGTAGPTFQIPTNRSVYLPDASITTPGTYLFYVRSVCSDSKGAWIGPVTVNVTGYCKRPYSITYTDLFNEGLRWQADYSPNNSQVQYGVHNFTLGTGTIKTVAGLTFNEAVMNAGVTYDFYVRLGCGSGWSSWVGPFSYFSATPHHLCTAPSGSAYTVQFSGAVPTGAVFTWNFNGENTSEFVIVGTGGNPNTGTINTFTAYQAASSSPYVSLLRNTNYDFYVRSICVSGSRTAWTGPMLVNIH